MNEKRTKKMIPAQRVVASEGALMTSLSAFVNIFAYLIWAGGKSILTGAFKSSFNISKVVSLVTKSYNYFILVYLQH